MLNIETLEEKEKERKMKKENKLRFAKTYLGNEKV